MYLSSMYRNYLGKSVYITFNDENLEWKDFELQTNPETGKKYKWSIPAGKIGKNQEEISGWIGILKMGHKRGSAAANAGISVMRRNRMIIGYPDSWSRLLYLHLEEVTINQRIVGEIVFNSAAVSHTKDAISPDHLDIMEALGAFVHDNNIKKIASQIEDESQNQPKMSLMK